MKSNTFTRKVIFLNGVQNQEVNGKFQYNKRGLIVRYDVNNPYLAIQVIVRLY